MRGSPATAIRYWGRKRGKGVLLWLLLWSTHFLSGGCRQGSGVPNSPPPPPTTVLTTPLKFQDVTQGAGISFQHLNGATGDLNLPETMGSGCAFLDYDQDGWLDILLIRSRLLKSSSGSSGSSCVLYHNNHNGTFTDVTLGSGLEHAVFGMGCAVGDYDKDGYPDIYLTSALDGSRLFHNRHPSPSSSRSQPLFEEVSQQAGVRNSGKWGVSAAWLDYDRDGQLDLFVCNYVVYQWGDNPRCSTPEHHRTYCNPHSFQPETCRLYRNLGNGRFRDVSQEAGIARATGNALGVLVFDYDDDGWMDILVACDKTANLLFHNQKGRFTEEAIGMGVAVGENGQPRAGMGIGAAYLWNDERLGVLVSNFSDEGLSFFTQNAPKSAFLDTAGAAGFANTSRTSLGFGLALFDMENDGRRDALVVNGHIDPWIGEHSSIPYAERPLLYHQRADGQFEEVGEAAGEAMGRARVSRGLAIGDYDHDGKLDLLIANNGQKAELLRNVSEPSGNWLSLRLVGKQSNRDAIGAQVWVTAGGVTQRAWRQSGSSYASENAPELSFGLGQSTAVERVEIRWPNGKRDRWQNLPINCRLRLQEGTAGFTQE